MVRNRTHEYNYKYVYLITGQNLQTFERIESSERDLNLKHISEL